MNNKSNGFDRAIERLTRNVAQQTSRRSFLARLAGYVLGASGLPLLPTVSYTHLTLPTTPYV